MKKFTFILTLLTIFVASATCCAKHLHPEKWYQDVAAKQLNGATEYRLNDGCRVDILTETHAIEVDFAGKPYQAVGQALYYAAKTGKQPGIILICEKESDEKYVERVRIIIGYWKLPIKVWVVRP